MALAPKVELRQGQSLVMTPALQQAIKLLQFTNVELAAFLEEELERNPLLERNESETGEAADTPYANDDDGGNGAEPTVPDSAELATGENGPGDDAPLDIDEAALYDDSPSEQFADPAYDGGAAQFGSSRGGNSDFDDGTYNAERAGVAGGVSLKDHLLSQIAVDIADPVDRLIGASLVDLLDEAGYLTGDLAAVAERVGCAVERVETTLARVQQFDPVGVFARSLAECLALQLKDRGRFDPAMEAFLANLELVARRDIEALTAACGVDADDIRDMLAEIRTLNPKPGLAFDTETAQPIVPDVLVRLRPDGSWYVELNSDTLPRVLVNRAYHARVAGAAQRRPGDKAFLTQQFHAANWLVKSLDQRARTILKVASEIVTQQDGFLRFGIEYLRPLNLKDIAQVIEMHESTVSRVTANKFVATPRGVYPLRYFFTSAIASSAGGESHSAEAVRHRIRDLIERESAIDILSDDQIVITLKTQGIDIARRTVAKYREAMHIPSSVIRRRLKKQSATA
jgi:RNA polymerase sigma-54 factor